MKKEQMLQLLESKQNDGRRRSAWKNGVLTYAIDLVESLNGFKPDETDYTRENITEALLNGARGWGEFSWGGSAYIYDTLIAKTLCTPSELKKYKNGARQPNKSAYWLDFQTRALFQACELIKSLFIVVKKNY